MYSYNLDLGPWGTYRVFKTSAETSKTEILATISGPGTNAAYIHSFFMTKDYVILCVWPSYFTGFGASLLWERNVIDALKYHPQEDTKWYIIDRKGKRGHIATFTSPAFFSFHTVNAFQEDNPETGTVDIFCDIVQFPNDGVIHKMYYENIISTGSRAHDSEYDRPSLVRYKLPGVPKDKGKLQGKRLRAEVVTTVPHSAELPVINPLYATKKQRYVYGIVDRGYSSFIDGLAKMDFETGNITYWGREPKPHTPSEAIFVPDGTNESEDAGYLLSVVLDGEMGTSYLVCLNARDMMEVARAEHSQPIGYGIHGVHYGL